MNLCFDAYIVQGLLLFGWTNLIQVHAQFEVFHKVYHSVCGFQKDFLKNITVIKVLKCHEKILVSRYQIQRCKYNVNNETKKVLISC